MSNEGDPGDRVIARRQVVLALGAGALAAPRAVFAQQPGKVRRIALIGVLARKDVSDLLQALEDTMRDHGYVNGNNLVYAQYHRINVETVDDY